MNIAEALRQARKEHYGIGAFNILDYLSARAASEAASECGMPVILQTSVGTVKYYGADELAAFISYLKERASVPVFLHLDHCKDVEFAKACVDAGWDAVMIDASRLPLAENIAATREAADYAHARGAFAEGELGVIEGVEEDIKAGKSSLAEYDDCMRFAEESHIDFFAPAIGTAHGVYKASPRLNFELVEKLGRDCPVPIVCHGGTGLSEETFRRLITLGIAKVNVSTALKHSFLDSAKAYLDESIEDYAPMKMIAAQQNAVKDTVASFIRIFANR